MSIKNAPPHRWTPSDYRPENLKSGRIPEDVVRAEYQRLRTLVRLRYENFQRYGLYNVPAFSYTHYDPEKMLPVSQIPRAKGGRLDPNLVYGLADLHKIIANPRGTVYAELAGREEEIKTLHKNDYNFVNLDNYNAWREYMKTVTNNGQKKAYGSERVAGVYQELESATDNPAEVVEKHRRAFENFLKDYEREETGGQFVHRMERQERAEIRRRGRPRKKR